MRKLGVTHKHNLDGSVTFFFLIPHGKTYRREKCLRTGPKCRKNGREYKRGLAKAREMAARRREEERIGRQVCTLDPRMLRRAVNEYISWMADPDPDGVPRSAQGTIDNHERHINNLLRYLKTTDWLSLQLMHHIPRAALASWRDMLIAEGKAASTVNTMLTVLASWFAWALDHGHCRENPMDKLLRCRVNGMGRPTSPLTDPEQMREALWSLLGKFPTYRRDTLLLLACTGLRSLELRTLLKTAVKLDDAVIEVPRQSTERTKRHERTTPLCPQALEAAKRLAKWSHGPYLIGTDHGAKPYTSALNKWLEKFGEKPHTLRKFFYTALQTIEAPENVIKTLMAHSPGKLDETYGGEQLDKLRKWVGVFGEWLGGPSK